jgi:hypothetical protein
MAVSFKCRLAFLCRFEDGDKQIHEELIGAVPCLRGQHDLYGAVRGKEGELSSHTLHPVPPW